MATQQRESGLGQTIPIELLNRLRTEAIRRETTIKSVLVEVLDQGLPHLRIVVDEPARRASRAGK